MDNYSVRNLKKLGVETSRVGLSPDFAVRIQTHETRRPRVGESRWVAFRTVVPGRELPTRALLGLKLGQECF
jgi:hypothetical protein